MTPPPRPTGIPKLHPVVPKVEGDEVVVLRVPDLKVLVGTASRDIGLHVTGVIALSGFTGFTRDWGADAQ